MAVCKIACYIEHSLFEMKIICTDYKLHNIL